MSGVYDPSEFSPTTAPPIGDQATLEALINFLFAFTPSSVERQTVLRVDQIFYIIESFEATRRESQKALLVIEPPLVVVGDIHGQFQDLVFIFKHFGRPPRTRYLFLGDYIDRGLHGIETLCLLYLFKARYPDDIHLLRGNHETQNVSYVYGFAEECNLRANKDVFDRFQPSFDLLPVAAVVGSRIFCTHGGISPTLSDLSQISEMKLPMSGPVQQGLLADLLWADPQQGLKGFHANHRGLSVCFGEDVVENFCKQHNVDLIVRGHQVVAEGFQFFANKKLLTLFSASNYCNEFTNSGAVMTVLPDLTCRIHQLKPTPKSDQKNTR